MQPQAVLEKAMKRISRIKFPQRHPNPSGSTPKHQETYIDSNAKPTFFPRSASSSVSLGGKASSQLRRTPMSQEEIDAILVPLYCRTKLNYRNIKPKHVLAAD